MAMWLEHRVEVTGPILVHLWMPISPTLVVVSLRDHVPDDNGGVYSANGNNGLCISTGLQMTSLRRPRDWSRVEGWQGLRSLS